MAVVLVVPAARAWATGSWYSLGGADLQLLIPSGFIGIFVGDTALFLTRHRMGPRRTAIAGVVLFLVHGKRRGQLHHRQSATGPQWAGIAPRLIVAPVQSFGSIIARPVMEAGTDPVAARQQ